MTTLNRSEVDTYHHIRAQLKDRGWMGEEEMKSLQKKIRTHVQDAVDFAEESPEPPLEELTQNVFRDQGGT